MNDSQICFKPSPRYRTSDLQWFKTSIESGAELNDFADNTVLA